MLAVERRDLIGEPMVCFDSQTGEQLKVEKAWDITNLCQKTGSDRLIKSVILAYSTAQAEGRVLDIVELGPGQRIGDNGYFMQVNSLREEDPITLDTLHHRAEYFYGINPDFLVEIILTHARDENELGIDFGSEDKADKARD